MAQHLIELVKLDAITQIQADLEAATQADRLATAADRVQTAADRAQTESDRATATAAAASAGADAATASAAGATASAAESAVEAALAQASGETASVVAHAAIAEPHPLAQAHLVALIQAALDLSGQAARACHGGRAFLAGGSAAEPALRIGTVGLYSSAADTLSVAVAGVERLRITSAGITVFGAVTTTP